MIYDFLLIAIGLILLLIGAEGLVRGSSTLALRFGLTPLVVGLTVVAFGTSSPELVVSLQAAFTNSGEIAVGNVVGSNISNIALILGLASVIRPMNVRSQLLRLDVPIMLGCSFLLVLVLLDGVLGRAEGLALTACIIAYTVFNVVKARKETSVLQPSDIEAVVPSIEGNLWTDLLFVVGGLGLLGYGAHLLVTGAIAIAESIGMSKAVIGLTIVAIGTSLPELAASVVAALKREGDIAIGNIVGSNVFNILGILGISAMVHPLDAGEIGLDDLAVMIGVALVLLPLMRSGFRISRWEGGLLLTTYVCYMWYVIP